MENIWKKLLAYVTCLLNTENDLKCQVDLWDMDLLHMEGVGFNPPALPACLVVWGLMKDCLSVLCFCLYSLS